MFTDASPTEIYTYCPTSFPTLRSSYLHHDARAGGNLEAAAQAELPLLAFDEHRVTAGRPRGLIAGNDAADRRRDDEIDLPERLADRLGQRAAQPFGARGILKHAHLQIGRAHV